VRHEALMETVRGERPAAGHRSGWLKLEADRSPGQGWGREQPRQCRGGPGLPDGSCPL